MKLNIWSTQLSGCMMMSTIFFVQLSAFDTNSEPVKLPLTFSFEKYIICSLDDTSEMAAILSAAVRPPTLLRRFFANETDPWSCPRFSDVWCRCWCVLCFTWSFKRSPSTGENPCTIWIGTNLFEIPEWMNGIEITNKNRQLNESMNNHVCIARMLRI